MKKLLVYLTGGFLIGGVIFSLGSSYLVFFTKMGSDIAASDRNTYLLFNTPILIFILTMGIGLLKFNNWARKGLVFLSGVGFLVGLLLIFLKLSIIFTLFSNFTQQFNSSLMLTFFPFWFVTLFYVCIPLFFLVFFTRRAVKMMFLKKGEKLVVSSEPLGIKILGIVFCLASATWLLKVFSSTDFQLQITANILISGMGKQLASLVMFACFVYLAYGSFNLKMTAWKLLVVVCIIRIVLGLFNVFLTSDETYAILISQMFQKNQDIPQVFYQFSYLMRLLVPVSILIYAYRKRGLFVN